MKKTLRHLALLAALTAGAMAAYGQENGDMKPGTCKAYLVCNGHLDTQWNWDVQTSIREYLPRTLFQNLYLMERYPEYIFNFEGGIKYAWIKEYYPYGYEELKKRIASGQWHVSGASWDAADTNIPSPESVIRNILLGQEFFKKEFGVCSTDIFLPDCFGFSFTLPSIAAHCGLIGMSTAKLNWRKGTFYDDPYHKKNPFSWGLWEGIDGKSVMAAFDVGGYNAELPQNVQNSRKLIARAVHGYDNTCLRYYSGGDKSGDLRTGDRGNSGTIVTCRRLREALQDKDAPVRVISAASDQMFKDYEDRKSMLPTYSGELLMDVHGTGCYTAQTAMKYYNRRNEELAFAAEAASVAADWAGALPYDGDRLNEIWKRFIWHQFHDDLTGTSIPEAYRWSWNDELLSLRQSEDVLTAAVSAFSCRLDTRAKGIPILVCNAAASPVGGIVEAVMPLAREAGDLCAFSPDGKKSPVQIVGRNGDRARVIFAADMPSAGYVVYDIRPGSVAKETSLKAEEGYLENSVYIVRTDKNGDIVSIVDKRCGKELVADGKSFRLGLTEGNESEKWPAWEIQKAVLDKESRPADGNVRISVAECGPVRATLKIERDCCGSSFVQYISLTEGAQNDRIDIRTAVEWDTDNALLKAEFPMSVSNAYASYDLGMGYVQRANNTAVAYEVPAQKWADLTAEDGSYGISILNNCKYGWDKPSDNMLRLTLIHTPGVKDRYTYHKDLDKGLNVFTYSIIGHEGPLDVPAVCSSAADLNIPLTAFSVPEHKGGLGRSFSMVCSTVPQLGIKALKKAEDGDGYIVRCCNLTENAVSGELVFPAEILSAEECNGIEEPVGQADVTGRSLAVNAGKFELKTFRVRLAPAAGMERLDVRGVPVELPYNATVFTTDEFHTYYMFDKERGTYAAELIPDTLSCGGAVFVMGEENTDDAVRCNGQTIPLPEGYDRLYILAASADEPADVTFLVGDKAQTVHVPLWKGYYGQWRWTGYSTGFLKDAMPAHVGTHRHKGDEGNLPYDFSYMYRLALDIPEGTESIRLPKDMNVAIFAMTVSYDSFDGVELLTELFKHPANFDEGSLYL